MSSKFKNILNSYRSKANNFTEVGNYFEKLSKVYLENDPIQTQEYSEVWHYKDWAKNFHDYSSEDIGIDLVAKLKNQEGYCAIQCKSYNSDHSISKSDIDSFISASSTNDFKRIVLIDTSEKSIGKNAKKVIDNLDKEYSRIKVSSFESSPIDWDRLVNGDGEIKFLSKKELREDQELVKEKVCKGLKEQDRGKIIMACGTGKTLTSLRIAEEFAGEGKMVLFMVPSLALMSQVVREWKNDAKNEFLAFSACSDKKVGNKKSIEDTFEIEPSDLEFPATTNAEKLSLQIKNSNNDQMIVVFSTYHSIGVISNSQFKYGLREFDLIICDEAHRTTGATLVEEDESDFVKIHDNSSVKGAKRLYMTATPRIYGKNAKKKELEGEVNLVSMDDESIYGPTFEHRSFGWAVENNLLTDYKVVVLVVDEKVVSERVQNSLRDGSELKLDDVTKIIGCYKALAKIGLKENMSEFNGAMQRAIAFCQRINLSKTLTKEFSNVVSEYLSNEQVSDEDKTDLLVEFGHVDGSFNAEERFDKLNWLKEEIPQNVCRVLSNARCLSEGVDVPSLDAIMFLHPRKSQIDVIQAVGRVMRKSQNKKLGYVILPIAVPQGISPESALKENERYEVIWQILNALRAHDERFDSTINRISLGEDVSDKIEIIETTSVIDDVRLKNKDKNKDKGKNKIGKEDSSPSSSGEGEEQLSFTLTDLSQAIKAKIVEKCGTRDYWADWAIDIAKIAETHIVRITSLVLNSRSTERSYFLDFLNEIRDDLNPEVTENEAIEMLAQHIITRPVFDCLFKDNRFTSHNVVTIAMEKILSKIYESNINIESESLSKFYASVKRRSQDINTSKGRQTLILELYDKFFAKAFPLLTQRLGIVYTPVEVVDFINNSVEFLMKEEFGSSLSEENVHIIDPFTGTGTFITRLLQSNIIPKEKILNKYLKELHANEIVLLAYYIACINIESIFDEINKSEDYSPFEGIVLTDTFQLYEQENDLIANLLPDNSKRRIKQKEQNINVVIGNPPYSSGQTYANDNAANINYPMLEKRIKETYSNHSTANSKTSLYDSYIKAFRWASDRIKDKGVIGFVTNAGWIDGNATDGFRKCIGEEFNKIYVCHLRGNQRTSGELSRKEGGKIFGTGSRAPIAITFLVKNHNTSDNQIFLFDIGDYLTREKKLKVLTELGSIKNLKYENKFQKIIPDDFNDWINQTEKSFFKLPLIGSKNTNELILFKDYSNGIKTHRDAWCYNFSRTKLALNCKKMTEFFNNSVMEFRNLPILKIKNVVTQDPKIICWSENLFKNISRGKQSRFDSKNIRTCLYRPFTKTNLYYTKDFNDRCGRMSSIFPDCKSENKIICVTGIGSKEFSVLMTDILPDVQLMFNGQNFPLKIYNINQGENNLGTLNLFDNNQDTSGLDKNILSSLNDYPYLKIKSDLEIFNYIYGILHSSTYREKYKNNLLKSLPRIPFVKSEDIFNQFSFAGKELGNLHVNYEKVEKYPCKLNDQLNGQISLLSYTENPSKFYRVNKMKFSRKGKNSVIYNKNIVINDIPEKAYNYRVNGKSALEWVMERQSIVKDKKTGIINDPNDFANEICNRPQYPLELFQRVITVSLKTLEIIDCLPEFEID